MFSWENSLSMAIFRVNKFISIENHHFVWENSLSMAIFHRFFDVFPAFLTTPLVPLPGRAGAAGRDDSGPGADGGGADGRSSGGGAAAGGSPMKSPCG